MHFIFKGFAAPVAGIALIASGCSTPPADAPPAHAQAERAASDLALCPGAERFDVEKIRAENTLNGPERAERITALAAVTPMPPGAEGAEALIRVRVPPTTMWQLDTRVTLWKNGDGAWQIATNNLRLGLPPPPPRPVLLPGEHDGYVPPPEPPPYMTSALPADEAERLDAFLSDPCFQTGPDQLSYSLPVHSTGDEDAPGWLCPPDSAAYLAEVSIAGEPVRHLLHSCPVELSVSRFLRFAAYLETAPVENAE